MPPSWDQTGVPGDEALAHFHSSTTSGSASWMSSRIRLSTEPRQSPSSRIRWSLICEAESGVWQLRMLPVISTSSRDGGAHPLARDARRVKRLQMAPYDAVLF